MNLEKLGYVLNYTFRILFILLLVHLIGPINSSKTSQFIGSTKTPVLSLHNNNQSNPFRILK